MQPGPGSAVRLGPLTLHLSLVHDEILGGAAALKLLPAALLRAELLVFPLVQGEERRREATVARDPRQSRKRVFLDREETCWPGAGRLQPCRTIHPKEGCLLEVHHA